MAIYRTLSVDAERWIQWSIRGGGWGAQNTPASRPPKNRRYRRKGSKKKKGLLQELLGRLNKLLGRGSTKKKGGTSKKPRARKTPKAPPKGYRVPIDTGDYARSWKWRVDSDGGILYNDSNPPVKAGVIEHGRKAAPIPIVPLADWVKRKLGVSDAAQARSIAMAISKKASRTKRPGLKVLARAHPKILEALTLNVARELAKVRPGT